MQAINQATFLATGCCDKYFLQDYMWFYDKKLLQQACEEFGDPLIAVHKIYHSDRQAVLACPLFEINWYDAYLDKHAAEIGYESIEVVDFCRQGLPPYVFANYTKYFTRSGASTGYLEFLLMRLRKDNLRVWANICKELRINILRCENSFMHYEAQREFLDILQPCILASSQEHAFGLNAGRSHIWWKSEAGRGYAIQQCKIQLRHVVKSVLQWGHLWSLCENLRNRS